MNRCVSSLRLTYIGGTAALPMGVAPKAASNQLWLVAVLSLIFSNLWCASACHWGRDSAPDGTIPRGCEQPLVVGRSLKFNCPLLGSDFCEPFCSSRCSVCVSKC